MGGLVMNIVYFLSAHECRPGVVRKRIGDRHRHIYHGVWTFPGKQSEPNWARPALSNSNRERLHVTRTGEFIPHVSSPAAGTLVVSDEVRARLSRFPKLEFLPVVFGRLVDLKMPALGDFDQDEMLAAVQALEFMNSLPDEPRYRESAQSFFYVLCPNFFEVEESLSDTKHVDTMWGRYQTHHLKVQAPLSAELLKRHPMYSASYYFVLSEECFTEIAPYLDLDYYYIDAFSLRPKVSFE